MRKYCYTLLFILCIGKTQAQITKFSMTPQQIEELFMTNNMELLAEKYNVTIADAAIIEAKLFPNPSISINDLNFWSSASQRDGETIPPLFGSFARNTQFSAELSQLVNLSGKRVKLIKAEKVNHEIALQQFELLLKSLKLELKQIINEGIYLQHYVSLLNEQQTLLNEMITAFEKQHSIGNLSSAELARIKLTALELADEAMNSEIELNGIYRQIKDLISNGSSVSITIIGTLEDTLSPNELVLGQLIDEALTHRTDLNINKLQDEYHRRNIAYEKSQRIPDLNLSVRYDRRGGVWPDFVGVGIGMDIPVFNRNQGAIKAAKAAKEQNKVEIKQQEIVISNEVTEAYMNYVKRYEFSQQRAKCMATDELDNLMGSYSKNLLNRNISLIEYMDFMEAYKNVKQITLSQARDLNNQLEELKYVTGTEIVK